MAALARQPWLYGVKAIYSSDEQKAVDGGTILSEITGAPHSIRPELGENDRDATGYLPPPEFETAVAAFFGRPLESYRGWERAVDAQARTIETIADICQHTDDDGAIAIVAHGGVGALLLCHLQGGPISIDASQPGRNGGNYLHFEMPDWRLIEGWRPIDG